MTEFAPGLHAAIGKDVDVSAYDRFTGRWSRLFVPDVIAAAERSPPMVRRSRFGMVVLMRSYVSLACNSSRTPRKTSPSSTACCVPMERRPCA
jgi:hypothetical protein